MSIDGIQCCGKSSYLFLRSSCDVKKKLSRRIFSPVQQIYSAQQHIHEIGNYYKDFKRKIIHREHRRRQFYPVEYLGSQNKRLSLSSTRDILQMPCFVFPRFGKNFPWRGRQTICSKNTAKIKSDTLEKISSANTIYDFFKLFQPINPCINPSSHSNYSDKSGISTKKLRLAGREPVAPNVRITYHQHIKGRTTPSKNIGTKGYSEYFDNETENLQWYIELASRCYNEGFQWHINYLNDYTRRSALLKRRCVTTAVAKFNRTDKCKKKSDNQLFSQPIDEETEKYGENFRRDTSECKIRININQTFNSLTNNNNNNTGKRSSYSYETHLNKKINIMNSGGYNFDALTEKNDLKFDKLNEVVNNFSSLKISSDRVLPKIVLTDFSSNDSMPRTNTLLLTPPVEQQFGISAIKSSLSTESLSIPTGHHYRNATRPY